jgi:hypothetical protein
MITHGVANFHLENTWSHYQYIVQILEQADFSDSNSAL